MSTDEECGEFLYDDSCGFIEKVLVQLRITQGIEIARRYLAMNAFDGVLPVLGILMGGLISITFQNPTVVFNTSVLSIIGTSFAMFVSGITSSYLTEGAERKRDIQEIEKSLLSSLDGSTYVKATKTTTIVVSIINGLSPAASALATAIPLYLTFLGLLNVYLGFFLSVVTGLIILYGLGVFLGRVSKSNVIVYGIKTLAAGIVVVAMMWVFSILTGAQGI